MTSLLITKDQLNCWFDFFDSILLVPRWVKSTSASSTAVYLAAKSQASDLTQACFEAATYAGFALLLIPVTAFTTVSRAAA